MKTIVCHLGPDLDAITSIWLIKMFLPEWEEASFAFVPAGKTLNDMPPDDHSEIMHVDTGFGKFDHHQTSDDTCAAKLVYEEIKKYHGVDIALERMIAIVNDIDHFREVFFPNPNGDIWGFGLHTIIDGWRYMYADNQLKIVELGMSALDAIYKTMQNKVWAEVEIEKNGIEFKTKWGKAIAFETVNDEVIHVSQKKGFVIVVRKDPRKLYLRIKALPLPEIDLSPVYERLKNEEPEATWFLHASHHMVLNGSAKNPDMRPSKRPLSEIIAVIQEVCGD
ncbi:MAG: chromate resistance protein ChrB domain-containing protein [Patescibacteria group bacterium]